MLANPSFESGTVGNAPPDWVAYGSGVSAKTVSSPVSDGSKAAEVTGRSASWHGLRQNMASNLISGGYNGETYEARADIYLDSLPSNVQIRLHYQDNVMSNQVDVVAELTNVPAGSWQTVVGYPQISWTGTLDYAYFEVYVDNSTTDYTLDDCSFRPLVTPSSATRHTFWLIR
jgi:hypothetical protein